MPRTTTVENSGCPPIRVITFDTLGLIKVLESHEDRGFPKVVERWGIPDSSRSILAASIDDRNKDQLLAVARKCSQIELLNPVNGERLASLRCGDEDGYNNIVGLHLLRSRSSSGSIRLLTCTSRGNASLWPIAVGISTDNIEDASASASWNVCASGNIEVCEVNTAETHALFGGKGVEMTKWDVEKQVKTWCAKSPPKNSLGIFTPTWFTSATFINNETKFAAGTSNHEIRIYDAGAQRRPVMSFGFKDSPIKALTSDKDGTTIYAGNASGDLASFDTRTGKMLGGFIGKCSGGIRGIVRHPELNVLASCGLDGFLRLWDSTTRQPLSAIFLKQHLTCAVFDSNFGSKVCVPESKQDDEVLLRCTSEAKELKKRKRMHINGSASKLKKSPLDVVAS